MEAHTSKEEHCHKTMIAMTMERTGRHSMGYRLHLKWGTRFIFKICSNSHHSTQTKQRGSLLQTFKLYVTAIGSLKPIGKRELTIQDSQIIQTTLNSLRSTNKLNKCSQRQKMLLETLSRPPLTKKEPEWTIFIRQTLHKKKSSTIRISQNKRNFLRLKPNILWSSQVTRQSSRLYLISSNKGQQMSVRLFKAI